MASGKDGAVLPRACRRVVNSGVEGKSNKETAFERCASNVVMRQLRPGWILSAARRRLAACVPEMVGDARTDDFSERACADLSWSRARFMGSASRGPPEAASGHLADATADADVRCVEPTDSGVRVEGSAARAAAGVWGGPRGQGPRHSSGVSAVAEVRGLPVRRWIGPRRQHPPPSGCSPSPRTLVAGLSQAEARAAVMQMRAPMSLTVGVLGARPQMVRRTWGSLSGTRVAGSMGRWRGSCSAGPAPV